jgi:hypothetical protein
MSLELVYSYLHVIYIYFYFYDILDVSGQFQILVKQNIFLISCIFGFLTPLNKNMTTLNWIKLCLIPQQEAKDILNKTHFISYYLICSNTTKKNNLNSRAVIKLEIIRIFV